MRINEYGQINYFGAESTAPAIDFNNLPQSIVLYGDSTTVGVGSASANLTGAYEVSPATLIAQKLSALGFESDNLSIIGNGNNTSNWSYGENYYATSGVITADFANWTNNTTHSIGGDTFESTDDSVMTFTIANCDYALLVLPIRDVYTGVTRWRVDGGSWNEVNHYEVNSRLARIPVDLGGIGTHTFEIQNVSGTSYFNGIEAGDSSKDFRIVNCGARAFTAANALGLGAPQTMESALQYLLPNVLLINFGINDVKNNSVNADDYKDDIRALIDNARLYNQDVIVFLLIPNPIDPSQTSAGLSHLPTSIPEIASEYSEVYVLDTPAIPEMVDFATAQSNGLMSDHLHPTASGYDTMYSIHVPYMYNALQGNINRLPTANAGNDVTVAAGGSVQVGGADSDSDGTIASISWSVPSGKGSLSNTAIAQPTYTAHSPTAQEDVVLTKTVTDNDGDSSVDTVTITVQAAVVVTPVPPTVAITQNASTHVVGDTIEFEVTASNAFSVSVSSVELNLSVATLSSTGGAFTATAVQGPYTVTVQATNPDGTTERSVTGTVAIVASSGSTLRMSLRGVTDGFYTVDYSALDGSWIEQEVDVQFFGGVALGAVNKPVGTETNYTVRTLTHVSGDTGVTE